MSESVPERLPAPTAAELERLWNQTPLDLDESISAFYIRHVFEIPGEGVYCYGKVLTGEFSQHQEIVLQGEAGYSHGQVNRIAVGSEFVDRVGVGQYATVELRRLIHRAHILNLVPGSRLYAW